MSLNLHKLISQNGIREQQVEQMTSPSWVLLGIGNFSEKPYYGIFMRLLFK